MSYKIHIEKHSFIIEKLTTEINEAELYEDISETREYELDSIITKETYDDIDLFIKSNRIKQKFDINDLDTMLQNAYYHYSKNKEYIMQLSYSKIVKNADVLLKRNKSELTDTLNNILYDYNYTSITYTNYMLSNQDRFIDSIKYLVFE